jgi:hypothetical protein
MNVTGPIYIIWQNVASNAVFAKNPGSGGWRPDSNNEQFLFVFRKIFQ